MSLAVTILIVVLAMALDILLILKCASLARGAIWAWGPKGGAASLEAKTLAESGQDVDWAAVERRHGHQSLVQSRLHRIRFRFLRLAIGGTYAAYALIPLTSVFLVASATASRDGGWIREAATTSTAFLVGLSVVMFLGNEFARAIGLGSAVGWHWSVASHRIFRDKPFTQSPGAGVTVGLVLLAVMIQVTFSSLTYYAMTTQPGTFEWDKGTVVPAEPFWLVRVWAFPGDPKPGSQLGYAISSLQGFSLALAAIVALIHSVNQREK